HIRPYKEYLEAGESLPPSVCAGAPVCLRLGAGQQGSSLRHGQGLPDGAGAEPALQEALCLLDHQLQLCGQAPGTILAPSPLPSCENSVGCPPEGGAVGKAAKQSCWARLKWPIILDPADPTGIVGEGSRWDLVAQEAEFCCDQQCCMDLDGDPVQPWDVPPEQTLEGSRGFEIHTGTQEYPDSAPQPGPTCTCTNNQAMANQQPSFCTIL
ncbi:unnamed protein product, partial [Caretta caretta]